MLPTICPYLGLKDDPDTAMHYPAAGNHCHHARPAAGVAEDHQRRYCLSAAHPSCPVYARAGVGPLPAEVRGGGARLGVGRGWWGALVVGLLVLGGLVGVGWWGGWWGRGAAGGIPVTGGSARTPFQPGAVFTRTPAATAELLFAFSPSPAPTRQDCPQPPGWEGYVVNPTDSLLRLSVLYNLPLAELLAVNCLGPEAVLRPGELIYVPSLATPTALPSPTATVFVRPAIVPTEEPTSRPASNRPRATQTPPRPTNTRQPTRTQAPPTFTVAPTQPPAPSQTSTDSPVEPTATTEPPTNTAVSTTEPPPNTPVSTTEPPPNTDVPTPEPTTDIPEPPTAEPNSNDNRNNNDNTNNNDRDNDNGNNNDRDNDNENENNNNNNNGDD